MGGEIGKNWEHQGKRNHNQNIYYEKKLFSVKKDKKEQLKYKVKVKEEAFGKMRDPEHSKRVRKVDNSSDCTQSTLAFMKMQSQY